MAKINTATVITMELPTEEISLENLEVTAVETKERLIEVVLKSYFRAYIGDGWIELGKGRHFVPEHIKNHLLAVNMLEAI